LEIAARLVSLVADVAHVDVAAQLKRIHCDFVAIMSCCRDLRAILSCSQLAAEVACARSIHAPPEMFHRLQWPCTSQRRKEDASRCILDCINRGLVSVATHCASRHCDQLRSVLIRKENRQPLGATMKVASASARQIALSGSRAFLLCSRVSKTDKSHWIVAMDLTPRLDEVARLTVDGDVLQMRASCDLLAFSTTRGHWTWDPMGGGVMLPVSVPRGAMVSDFWVGNGHVKLALSWDQNMPSASTSVAHAAHGQAVHRHAAQIYPRASNRPPALPPRRGLVARHDRYTNATPGSEFVWMGARPSEDSSLALVGLVGHTVKRELHIYNIEQDTSRALLLTQNRVAAFCLNPAGNCACIFELFAHTRVTVHIYVHRHAGMWSRISRNLQWQWAGPRWPASFECTQSYAVFMACGRRVLFSGALLTSRVAVASLQLDTLHYRESNQITRVQTCTVEARPVEILCSSACALLRTHRGALIVSTTNGAR
tara:strand:- start:1871 stop:3325 length:1455 start_codon:yes stop_codon:yes gene_type:complete